MAAIEKAADGPLTAAESRLRAALRDLCTIFDRDGLLIMAVAATQEAVIVSYNGAEVTVSVTAGSKIHQMLDVAMAALELPKEQRDEFALYTQDDHPLAEPALARYGIAPGDRLKLGPRP